MKRFGIPVFALPILILFASAQPALPGQDHALWERANHARGELLKDLETLVNIDSPADYAPGMEKIKDFLSEKLMKMGAQVETLSPARAGHNIVATFTGNGKGKILLLAHSDTVFKPGTTFQRSFRISGGRAFGPGVFDEKGGVVTGLHALKILKDSGFQNFARITFLINCDEEIGSVSSRDLIKKLAHEHDCSLCLEGGREGDGVVSWRKGSAGFLLEVKGKASHAGNAPDRGANALVEMAHQILQLRTLENREKGTTINFTVCKSGEKTNVIPESAMARADMRVLHPEEVERVEKAALEMIRNRLVPDTQVKLTIHPGRPPLPRNKSTDALIARAQAIYQEIGLTLKTAGSGGGSDGNFTALVGCPTLDGLGIVGGQGHTADEYINVESIPPRLYLLTRMMMELGQYGPAAIRNGR